MHYQNQNNHNFNCRLHTVTQPHRENEQFVKGTYHIFFIPTHLLFLLTAFRNLQRHTNWAVS